MKYEEGSLPMKWKYKNLIIIGNGFDRWQELPTSYDNFKQYYFEHILSVCKKFKIKVKKDDTGNLITPVELIFGDIFRPDVLSNEFFWNFETAMSMLDDQYISLYYGKTNRGLYKLQKTVDDALKILQNVFGSWISSIEIEEKDSGYVFDNSCYCINFNYTNTLEKRFSVDFGDINYIHGEFENPESIVFGHSTHPETAFPELMKQKFIHRIGGGKSKRLRSLYLIENALYETDKHVQDNIDNLCEFMTLDGVHIEDITDIYVLGHSFGKPDYEYFEFLVKATQAGIDFNELSFLWKARNLEIEKMDEDDLLEWIQMNVAYACNHRKRELQKENISFPENELLEKLLFGDSDLYTDKYGEIHKIDKESLKAQEAVYRRFVLEQAARTKQVIEELCCLKSVSELPSDCYSILGAADYIDGGHDKRIKNAKWHISYFSNKDKEQIKRVMSKAGCKDYELYNSIDECIECFKRVKGV